MKNKMILFFKKQWIFIWAVLVTSAFFSMVAFAEYPGTNNIMKRVVLSDESTDTMFSSNILTKYENNTVSYQPYYVKQLKEDDVSDYYDVDVYIWNYDIDGSGDYYKKQIDYDLSIKVVDTNGNTVSGMESGKMIRVKKNDAQSLLASFSSASSTYEYKSASNSPEIIAAGRRNFNKYTIQFSKSWNLKNDTGIRVMMIAEPTDDFPDLKPLAASIGLKEERASASTGWKYYINEQRLDTSKTPHDYDAYNMILTGTGNQTIEIEWDPSKVVLNKKFYEANGAFSFAAGEINYSEGGGSRSGWDKLTVSANSYDSDRDYRNRYDIQFYKTSGEISSAWNFIDENWSENVYITINIPTDSDS